MSATIVCIDDEPALCRIFQSVLRRTGATVQTFTDPHLALAFIRNHDVALVICDQRMPTLSGLEVLAQLPGPIPFVMVSGDLEVHQFGQCATGLTAVLAKPFAPDELLALARLHLGGGPGADG